MGSSKPNPNPNGHVCFVCKKTILHGRVFKCDECKASGRTMPIRAAGAAPRLQPVIHAPPSSPTGPTGPMRQTAPAVALERATETGLVLAPVMMGIDGLLAAVGKRVLKIRVTEMEMSA